MGSKEPSWAYTGLMLGKRKEENCRGCARGMGSFSPWESWIQGLGLGVQTGGFLECTLEVHVSRVCGKILFTFQGCMGGFCKSLGADPKQTLANVGPAYVDLEAMGVE